MSQIKKCESCGKIVDVLYGKYQKGQDQTPDYSEISMQKICETCADKLLEEKNWGYTRLVD